MVSYTARRIGPSHSRSDKRCQWSSWADCTGQIISIFANPDTNPIGPTNALGLQLDNSGKVATTLGGVQVHFLPVDAYAPLTFVGAGQINAVVPYDVAGLSSVNVQVQYSGQASDAVDLQVAPTAPGIFTANGSGVGPGAIFNQDGMTVNGPSHPQSRGGYVTVFATGEGQTSPPGVSGAVTTVAVTPPPHARAACASGSSNQRAASPLIEKARPIKYCKKYPEWTPQGLCGDPRPIVLTKAADWCYEREFRLIASPLVDGPLKLDGNFVALPDGALTAIIVGCKNTDIDEVHAIVAEHAPGLRIKWATLVPYQYQLTISDEQSDSR